MVLGTEQPERVAILRALQLGDLLCAVPFFRAVRCAWPSARTSLIGLPWARALVDRFPVYLDEFIEFPGFPGLPERPVDVGAVPAFLTSMQRRRFDLAIQLQGDGTITNGLVTLFGARRLAGFYPAAEPAPAGTFAVYPEDRHEIRRLLSLVPCLGIPVRGEQLEFPVRRGDEGEWSRIKESACLKSREFVCLHPGARAEARRWSAARFASLGRVLVARGLRVVVTGDGAAEAALADTVVAAIGKGAQSLAGRTTLGCLAALLRDARLIVCNDTGVSHLAAALGTPSVVIFRVTEPARWAPLDQGLHRVVHDGAHSVERVVAETEDLLAREGAGAV